MSTATETIHTCHWLGAKQALAVCLIDQASYTEPLSEADVMERLRDGFTYGKFIELPPAAQDSPPRMGGYILYRNYDRHVEIARFGVDPMARRSGVGRALVRDITSKLDGRRRWRAWFDVDERDTDRQLFLRACGWKCVAIFHPNGPQCDAIYRFEYRVMKHGTGGDHA